MNFEMLRQNAGYIHEHYPRNTSSLHQLLREHSCRRTGQGLSGRRVVLRGYKAELKINQIKANAGSHETGRFSSQVCGSAEEPAREVPGGIPAG